MKFNSLNHAAFAKKNDSAGKSLEEAIEFIDFSLQFVDEKAFERRHREKMESMRHIPRFSMPPG